MADGARHLEKRVESVLSQIKPYLDADGVQCQLSHVSEGIAYVKLTTVQPMSTTLLMTIKMGIERKLVEAVSQIEAVEPV